MPKKSITLSTEDLVLWQRVTSKVTPLKSTTKPVTFANLGADVTETPKSVFEKECKNTEKNGFR